MQIRIDYNAELEANLFNQIKFIREEFEIHFGHKLQYNYADKRLAEDLINYLAKIVNSPNYIDFLVETLEQLENDFPNLF